MEGQVTGPRLMCACCQRAEVGVYQLACEECRRQLELAGLIKPAAQLLAGGQSSAGSVAAAGVQRDARPEVLFR